MPKLEYIIPFEKIIEDKRTKQMSYISTIDNINSTKAPIQFPIALAVCWIRYKDPEGEINFSVRLKIFNPKGKIIQKTDPIEMKLTKLRYRLNVSVLGLEFLEQGKYTIAVEKLINDKWRRDGSTVINFRVKEKLD